ncbi:hypothetical protein [Martelella sp. HB161492]|uniref:hypothetical protein n=1 Tax=Martelella sp. HB161492 TaxID=2720726 RepID=UPI00158FAEAD|nr:hypothetical protein [Martelella sp. HB161492]
MTIGTMLSRYILAILIVLRLGLLPAVAASGCHAADNAGNPFVSMQMMTHETAEDHHIGKNGAQACDLSACAACFAIDRAVQFPSSRADSRSLRFLALSRLLDGVPPAPPLDPPRSWA